MKSIKLIKKHITLENICLLVCCIAALFSSSKLMTDHAVIPRQLFTALIFAISIAVIAIKIILKNKINIDFSSWSFIIIFFAVVEAIYAIFQFCVYKYIKIGLSATGSFENPVGLMTTLCLSLPFLLYLLTISSKYKRMLISAMSVLLVAIIISESRTGIIAALLILAFCAIQLFKISSPRYIFAIVIILLLICGGSYFVNSDSADGRLLIWRSCLPLLMATPFFGYGLGAFERLYMDAQAQYLGQFTSDSRDAMLAGNPLVPFNEYINFYLNFGIFGSLVLIAFISFLIYSFYRRPTESKRFAFMSLMAIAFISFFFLSINISVYLANYLYFHSDNNTRFLYN